MYGRLSAAAALLSVVSANPVIEERVAVTQTLAYAQPSQSCIAGANIIVARESLEPQGFGLLEDVANNIMKMVPNSAKNAVVYPATEEGYATSEQEGVVGMKQQVTDYVNACPGHWVILMGYSQGAQVVGDTVIGSNETNFSDQSTNSIGLGKNYLAQIAAMVQMGDTAFTTNVPGSMGTAKKNGIFARRNVDAYTQYGLNDKMAQYCDEGDMYCASGDSLAVHVGYVSKYGSAAASFAASKFTSVNGGAPTGGSGGSGSNGGGSSAAMTSAAQSSAAAKSSAPATSKAGGGAATSSASKMTQTGAAAISAVFGAVPVTSNRYTPTTSFLPSTFKFTQLAQPTHGAAPHDQAAVGAAIGAAVMALGMM